MRVRFAPSPTGYLHIGNARTAVINYLVSKKNNSPLVLRVEDTDLERSTKESEISIMDDLKWLGIEWTEGPDLGGEFGPYRQSERFDIYKKYTEKLIAEGKAYYCYCTKEELDEMRDKEKDGRESFVYPGKCRNLTQEERDKFEAEGRKPTVRFKVPEGKEITVKDMIKGDVKFSSENIGGDFIIVRSDGTPIYNYIVTIDDTLMNITHVVRGEDHLSNTPKQILVAEALGLPVPIYAHMPLVLGSDRSKLSKRHGITSVDLYRKEGYLPEALMNYLCMLGWATESGEEILTSEEIISQFDINSMGKSAAIFDFKKLKWMNSIYIRDYPEDKILPLFNPYIEETGYRVADIDSDHLKKIILLMRNYCEVLSDIKNFLGMFLEEINQPDEDADAMLREDYSREIISAAYELYNSQIDETSFVSETVSAIKSKTTQKGKKLFMPVRAMLTGRLKGPELDLALPLIGFENCRKRVEYCYKTYCS